MQADFEGIGMNSDILLGAMSVALVIVAVLAAAPSLRRRKRKPSPLSDLGDPLAGGVFLGAGLLHMLPDAVDGYLAQGVRYPWPFVICGSVALSLLLLQRLGSGSRAPASLSLFAAAALSIHSLLAGAALGGTSGKAALILLFVALIAHKGAASFSLSRLLAQSQMSRGWAITVQCGFIFALPLGVGLGAAATHLEHGSSIVVPAILAAGAGTFLYFGGMHRPDTTDANIWAKSAMAILGFAVMAVVAAVG